MHRRWWVLGGIGGGLGILGACSLPNLVEVRKHGNEAAAVGALKTVMTAQSLYREGDKDGNGEFDYAGTTGDRYFATNQTGVVFYKQTASIALNNPDCQIPADLLPVGKGSATPEAKADFAATRGGGAHSTLALEVDTAAWVTLRQSLARGTLPTPDAVRIEELINAFEYGDPSPPATGATPLAARIEVSSCPWRPGHRLVRIGVRAREVSSESRPAANLVLLVDASSSMRELRKLHLAQEGLRLLVRQLDAKDRVSIVVAGSRPRVALPPTRGTDRARILAAIDRLEAGGPRARAPEALALAHETALRAFLPGGANRILYLGDGQLDPGPGGLDGLARAVALRARSGVSLSAIGLGLDPKDAALERLARGGNGQHLHLDGLTEARRVFVEQLAGTVVTVAREVKAQVAWDPARVRSWRLIGHEDARLAAREFRDDRVGGGELGAGHSVVALWEVEPVADAPEGPLGVLGLRWVPPGGGPAREVLTRIDGECEWFEAASADLRFTAAVAALGMLLRGRDAGSATLDWIRATADAATSADPRRVELVELIEVVRTLEHRLPPVAAGPPRTSGLKQLADASLIDGVLGAGEKQGYRFELHAHDDGFRWMATANPKPGCGDRAFVTNQTGVVYYSQEAPFALNAACEIPAHAIPVGK